MMNQDWQHIWQQVPAPNRSDIMRANIEAASPKLAIAMLKDLFMIDNPSDRGLTCSLPGDQLLPILMEFYRLKGGPEPEAEQQLWAKLLKA